MSGDFPYATEFATTFQAHMPSTRYHLPSEELP